MRAGRPLASVDTRAGRGSTRVVETRLAETRPLTSHPNRCGPTRRCSDRGYVRLGSLVQSTRAERRTGGWSQPTERLMPEKASHRRLSRLNVLHRHAHGENEAEH